MSRWLISYRRLVVSCFKMTFDGSIIVEICDKTKAKTWRKPVEIILSCRNVGFVCLHVFGVFRATLISGVCFSLRLLYYGKGDPLNPHLNLRGKHFFLLFCARENELRERIPVPHDNFLKSI